MTSALADPELRRSLETVLAQVERLAQSNKTAEAKSYLKQIWPIIGDGIDIAAENVNLFAGMALAYHRLSQEQACRKYATIALIAQPKDMLALALLPPSERIILVRQLLHHQQTTKAIQLLNTIESYAPTRDSAFFLKLITFYEAQKIRAMKPPPLGPKGRPTLLNISAWGSSYIEKLFKYSLPSLLAPGNIPALSQFGNVHVDVYTSAHDREVFRNSELMATLAQYADIEYTILPDNLLFFENTEATADHDRFVVAGAQYNSAIRAKHVGADLFYVTTDAIYSNNMLQSAKGHIEAGYKAVLTIMLRAQEDKIDNYLKQHAAINGHAISIDTKHLINFAAENLNPQVFDSFIRSNSPHIGQDPIALFFKTPTGFSSHTFQITGTIIANDILLADFAYDYHTQDARLLAEVTAGRDPATLFKVIENPRDAFVAVDLDSGTDGLERTFGSFTVDTETCANSAMKWCQKESDFDYFEWAFQQRFELDCATIRDTLPDSDFDEAETVAAFLDRFRALKVEKQQRIKAYRSELYPFD